MLLGSLATHMEMEIVVIDGKRLKYVRLIR